MIKTFSFIYIYLLFQALIGCGKNPVSYKDSGESDNITKNYGYSEFPDVLEGHKIMDSQYDINSDNFLAKFYQGKDINKYLLIVCPKKRVLENNLIVKINNTKHNSLSEFYWQDIKNCFRLKKKSIDANFRFSFFKTSGEQLSGFDVVFPKDIEIISNTYLSKLISDYNFNNQSYQRVYFNKDSRLITNGLDLKFTAKEIISQNGEILSFLDPAKDTLDGDNAGSIEIKANSLFGHLDIINSGQTGGKGTNSVDKCFLSNRGIGGAGGHVLFDIKEQSGLKALTVISPNGDYGEHKIGDLDCSIVSPQTSAKTFVGVLQQEEYHNFYQLINDQQSSLAMSHDLIFGSKYKNRQEKLLNNDFKIIEFSSDILNDYRYIITKRNANKQSTEKIYIEYFPMYIGGKAKVVEKQWNAEQNYIELEEVELGENYSIKIISISNEFDDASSNFEVLMKKDLMLDKSIDLSIVNPFKNKSNESINFGRINLSDKVKILTKGNPLKIIASEIKSNNGKIIAFEGPAPDGMRGKDSASIIIKSPKIIGAIEIDNTGQNGGSGTNNFYYDCKFSNRGMGGNSAPVLIKTNSKFLINKSVDNSNQLIDFFLQLNLNGGKSGSHKNSILTCPIVNSTTAKFYSSETVDNLNVLDFLDKHDSERVKVNTQSIPLELTMPNEHQKNLNINGTIYNFFRSVNNDVNWNLSIFSSEKANDFLIAIRINHPNYLKSNVKFFVKSSVLTTSGPENKKEFIYSTIWKPMYIKVVPGEAMQVTLARTGNPTRILSRFIIDTPKDLVLGSEIVLKDYKSSFYVNKNNRVIKFRNLTFMPNTTLALQGTKLNIIATKINFNNLRIFSFQKPVKHNSPMHAGTVHIETTSKPSGALFIDNRGYYQSSKGNDGNVFLGIPFDGFNVDVLTTGIYKRGNYKASEDLRNSYAQDEKRSIFHPRYFN